MAEVYFYVPSGDSGDAVECGLKLSRWADRECSVQGVAQKYMAALLNPKDDMGCYRSERMRCLKLEMDPKYCLVADRRLYEAGLNMPGLMEKYWSSTVPVLEYRFGMHRLPECLVSATVLPGQITLLDRRLDSPVLVDDSEALYVNNIMENLRERYEGFNDALLYHFYTDLARSGVMEVLEDRESGIAVFIEKSAENGSGGGIYVIKAPDMPKMK